MMRNHAPRILLACAFALGALPAAAAAETPPNYWVFGTELPAPPPAPQGPAHLSAPKAPDGKLEQYDYPGEYAQRFDGIDKGGKDDPSGIRGRSDLSQRLHRGTAPTPSPALKTR